MNAMYNLLGKNRFWILLFFLLLLVSSCIAYYFSQVRQEQCVAYIYQDGAVCVQQGWIDDGIYPIVCLPNKLIIRIKDENGDTTVPDVMTQ